MKNDESHIKKLFDFDNEMSLDDEYLIGTDEAGRGPGAGPVFAAAVCFVGKSKEDIYRKLQILNDSKQLTEKKREELFECIKSLEKDGLCFCSVHEGSVSQIDKMNILNTSLYCMKQSCEEVVQKINSKKVKVLVDGNRLIKNFSFPQQTVVKGDAKSAAIAAASIIAKVCRDRYMFELSKKFPRYHWDKNKGYLSKEHIDAIKEYGVTKWHRKKFLRKILQESGSTVRDEQLSLF